MVNEHANYTWTHYLITCPPLESRDIIAATMIRHEEAKWQDVTAGVRPTNVPQNGPIPAGDKSNISKRS